MLSLDCALLILAADECMDAEAEIDKSLRDSVA